MRNISLILLLSFVLSFVMSSCGDMADDGNMSYNNTGDYNNSNNYSEFNNVNNTNSVNNTGVSNNNENNTEPPTPEELQEILCADATDVETSFFMSADDSASQAQPALARTLITTGYESNTFYSEPREYEFLNYYSFDYEPAPTGELAIRPELRYDELKGEYNLLVGVVSHHVELAARRPFNFTFSVDTSGSMGGSAIETVRYTLLAIASQLREGDVVSMVTWSTSQSYPLNGHVVSGPSDPAVVGAINALQPGGGTDLHAGLTAAYQLAQQNYMVEGVNRVFLLSDGGANVGITDADFIAAQTEHEEGDGIFMIGVGANTSYYNHQLMDTVTDVGKGAYVYISDENEAYKMFGSERILSNVEVAALDVRLQVTFPPLFVISQFHGEQISTVPEEVKQQHLAPNDAMLYHSNLLYCVDEETAGEELFTFSVTWTDPVTRTPQSRDMEITLGELLDSEAVNLEKSNILVAYARLISNADRLDAAAWGEAKLSLSARIEAYQELMSDDDLVEVQSVLAQTYF